MRLLPRPPLQLGLILLAAVGAALIAAVAFMNAPPTDVQFLATFLVASGAISLALAGVVIRLLGRSIQSMRGRLAIASTSGVLIALVNVLATAVLMFLSPHDLALLMLLLGFAAVLSLAFVYVTASSLTARLEHVSRAAARLARGDLDARVKLAGNDETARLGRAFDHMADSLQRAFEHERALESDRRNLIAAISHDLRTPLATSRAMVEAISDGVVSKPDDIDRYVKLIGGEIRHLGLLIDDLFELSQIESGALQLRPRVVDLHVLIGSVLASYQARAEYQGIQLECAAAAELSDTRVLADPDRLERVLRNLLDNALHYTPSGGVIRIEQECTSENITVAVADSGPGIPADERELIFQRSYRTTRSRPHAEAPGREDRSGGLGLAIARGLVQAHRGRIWAEASWLGGARLCFSLPLYESKQSAMADV